MWRQLLFDFIPSVKIIEENGEKYLRDKHRDKKVRAKPEELVRQKVLRYLQWVIRVPKKNIEVEVHMSRYGYTDNKKRADIIVSREDGTTVLAVIECKAPNIKINDSARRQVFCYADCLNAEYAFVFNGVNIEGYQYAKRGNQYLLMQKITSYKQMCQSNENSIPQKKVSKLRSSLKQISDINYIKGKYSQKIGFGTSEALMPVIVNLYDCLFDMNYKMTSKQYAHFKVNADLGIRRKEIATPGGTFNNEYRLFDITDHEGNRSCIGFSITPYCSNINSDEKTAIVVYHEDKEQQHHALQLVIDKHMIREKNDEFTITHDGRINVGRLGTAKINEVKTFVFEELPSLMRGDKIYLGTLRNDKLLTVGDKLFEDFLVQMVSYSLILDRFRENKKKEKRIDQERSDHSAVY